MHPSLASFGDGVADNRGGGFWQEISDGSANKVRRRQAK
jgi:hypothetical protein